MKRILTPLVVAAVLFSIASYSHALSEELRQPKLFLPQGFDPGTAQKIQAVLSRGEFKFLGGLTSYWEPKFGTTLVYDADTPALYAFIAELARIPGMQVKVTFSADLSKETGSALQAGAWFVKYGHTTPNVIQVRINLASKQVRVDQLLELFRNNLV
jgi:hypothetical protein